MRWFSIVGEFGVVIIHRKGVHNVGADALSRLPIMDPEEPISILKAQERFETSYLFYPVQYRLSKTCPIRLEAIQESQLADPFLQNQLNPQPTIREPLYHLKAYGTCNIIEKKTPAGYKIVIPTAIAPAVLNWYHETLQHPGATRLINTIRANFYLPKLQELAKNLTKSCDICQRIKDPCPREGQLAEKPANLNPWEEVAMDLVGPWKFKIGKVTFIFQALTCIDPFIGLLEIIRILNKTSAHVATKANQAWFCRYPTPRYCVHDGGSEFVSQEFQDVLRYYGVKSRRITPRNPQGNAMIERVHLTMGSILRAMVVEYQQANRVILPADMPDFLDTAAATCQKAVNSTIHTVTQLPPGNFAFSRDMHLPVQCVANWDLIRARKQAQIHKNVLRENSRRSQRDWQVGDLCMLSEHKNKLDAKFTGPYRITIVHTNGNVTIRKTPHVTQRDKIRRICPYHPPARC